MSSFLAKIHKPTIDVRKPYTKIGGSDSFSGRTYDEGYITTVVNKHNLPCNSTTAFLTPAFRNRDQVLTTTINLVGRPPRLYQAVLDLLDDVYSSRVKADDMLAEIVRCLLIARNENDQRMLALIADLKTTEGAIPLSSEDIVDLIRRHLQSKGTSRLPVLMVAAAYKAVEIRLGERVLALHAHNAADIQTGALGDVEITLQDDNSVVTSYEMKTKRVLKDDIDRAMQKLVSAQVVIDNYIFITTDEIDDDVQDYARSLYEKTAGIEFVILDCIGFIRHFLHIFHRLRADFLEHYQQLILAEPESSVSQALKESFLSMRRAAESY